MEAGLEAGMLRSHHGQLPTTPVLFWVWVCKWQLCPLCPSSPLCPCTGGGSWVWAGEAGPGATQLWCWVKASGSSPLCGRDFAVTAVFSSRELTNPPAASTSKNEQPLHFFLLPTFHLPLGTQLDALLVPFPHFAWPCFLSKSRFIY